MAATHRYEAAVVSGRFLIGFDVVAYHRQAYSHFHNVLVRYRVVGNTNQEIFPPRFADAMFSGYATNFAAEANQVVGAARLVCHPAG